MKEGRSSGPGNLHIQTPGKQRASGLVELGVCHPKVCGQLPGEVV